MRQDVFEIDAHRPDRAPDAAFALWVARVRPARLRSALPPGRLTLEFWVPDREYAAYMRRKGHWASYGDVTLVQSDDRVREGRITVSDLSVAARCTPSPEDRALGPGGALVYTRADEDIETTAVGARFIGHRERVCTREEWRFSGSHPIVIGSKVEGTVFQFGYTLRGGAYRR